MRLKYFTFNWQAKGNVFGSVSRSKLRYQPHYRVLSHRCICPGLPGDDHIMDTILPARNQKMKTPVKIILRKKIIDIQCYHCIKLQNRRMTRRDNAPIRQDIESNCSKLGCLLSVKHSRKYCEQSFCRGGMTLQSNFVKILIAKDEFKKTKLN